MLAFEYYEVREKEAEEIAQLPQPIPPEEPIEPPAPLPEKEIAPPPGSVITVHPATETTYPQIHSPSDTVEEVHAYALREYIAYLQDIIDLQLEYPEPASRQGREGEVTVIFTLDRTGKLLALSIPPEGRSAFHPFNRAALKAVRRAARYFDAFPEVLTKEAITFRLPIIFTLN